VGYFDELQAIEPPKIAELYIVSSGPFTNYYTSFSEDVLFQGNNYKARSIERTNFNRKGTLTPTKINIKAPIDNLLQKYIANTPSEPVFIDIISTLPFVSGLPSAQFFRGRVVNATIAENMIAADCESRTQIFRNKVPSVIYQSRCNHQLFSTPIGSIGACNLLKTNYLVTATVTVVGASLVSPTFATFPNDYFTGGFVEFGLDARWITKHIADTIYLQVPFDSRVITGAIVFAFPGCDKKPETCRDKFSNSLNFLGFPYIPSQNPVIWGFSR
jgi:hypothetical protein